MPVIRFNKKVLQQEQRDVQARLRTKHVHISRKNIKHNCSAMIPENKKGSKDNDQQV